MKKLSQKEAAKIARKGSKLKHLSLYQLKPYYKQIMQDYNIDRVDAVLLLLGENQKNILARYHRG